MIIKISQVFGGSKFFGLSSTNHRFAYFCDYIIVSMILGGVVFCN
jgi:hypothetical protein